VVAFVVSLIVTLGLTALVVPVAKRRPVGAPLSWGEAMVAATWAFGIMFLAYGVVPHQWLSWADNELNWRADKILHGWGDFLDKLPFVITYQAVRDIIVTGIYVVLFVAQVALWVWWQKRGERKEEPLQVTSTYGRPLARRG